MNFSVDADLLAYEPTLFVDVPLDGQTVLQVGDGEATGNVLTSATGGFDALWPGSVVVLRTGLADAIARAVDAVSDDHTLSVTVEPMGLAATTGLTVIARTFEPQRTIVHEQLMEAIGLSPADPTHDLDETDVVSVGLMRRLETLGTAWRAYEAAMSGTGGNEAMRRQADRYRRMFDEAMSGARVLIDTDGDGRANVWRTPATGRWVRG